MFRGGSPASGNAAITGGNTSFILAESWVAVSVPADTTEDVLATIPVPAGITAGSSIRVYTRWSVTNNTNAKQVRIRYSGASGTQYQNTSIASMGSWADMREIDFITQSSQTGFGLFTSPFGQTSAVEITSSVDASVLATSIVISGQKTVSGDVMTLTGYRAELHKP